MLTLGIISSSRKENEHRLPLHPDHFDLVPDSLRQSMRFESGYGTTLRVQDKELTRRFGGVASRAELLDRSDIVLLPKPMSEDLRELHQGGVLWGWPHCVQQRQITQAAIDGKLTLIAFEAMYTWKSGSVPEMHLFDRNNEMAGYCSVIHALGLAGKDGNYGPPARACVISHGSVSRGAIHALQGRGFHDITVYTQRPPWAVHDKIAGCRYSRFLPGDSGQSMTVVEESGNHRPLIEALSEADVIVNGILQDTDKPLMFLQEGEENRLAQGALIVDVSCDLAMGFPFARPTSFENPTFAAGPSSYYAVDHTPSYLWQSASWEISRVVVSFLESVMGGPASWEENETVRRAIEIQDGIIKNEKILHFQNRSQDYPHPVIP
jgi:alanine dehydrogenase